MKMNKKILMILLVSVLFLIPSLFSQPTVNAAPNVAGVTAARSVFADVYCLTSSSAPSARLTVNLATGEYEYVDCSTSLSIEGEGKPFVGNDPDILDVRGIFHIKENRTLVAQVDEGDLSARARFIHNSSGVNVFFDNNATVGACTCP